MAMQDACVHEWLWRIAAIMKPMTYLHHFLQVDHVTIRVCGTVLYISAPSQR